MKNGFCYDIFFNNKFKNNEFELIANDKFFIYKTGLIEKMNSLIEIKYWFVRITPPRRFDKIANAMMFVSK